MIKKLELRNFESHKNSTLEFTEGLNAIIGSGDNGKSSIIRAFLWVLYNKPDGDNYVSHWNRTKTGNIKGETSVTIITENGWVKRAKNKSDNYYSINGEEYRAFGKSVPEQVTEFLNLSDTNIQTQFDNHYLLSESASEVAKQLNQIVNLEKIDNSIKNGNTYIRGVKSKIKHLNDETTNLEAELETFEGLDVIDGDLENLEKLELEKAALEQQINSMKHLIMQISNAESSLADLPNVTSISETLNTLITKATSAVELHKTIMTLTSTCEHITNVRKKTIGLKRVYDKVDKELASIPDVSDIISAIDSIVNLINKISTNNSTLQSVGAKIKELEVEYKETLGDSCPLCGGAIHE
jgi:DNA repair protein SbcC/Rad50